MRKVEAKGKGETAEPLSLDVEPQTPRVNRKGSTATGKGDKKGKQKHGKGGEQPSTYAGRGKGAIGKY